MHWNTEVLYGMIKSNDNLDYDEYSNTTMVSRCVMSVLDLTECIICIIIIIKLVQINNHHTELN